MGWLNTTYFLGARLIYWGYLLVTLIGFGFVIAWTQRERIKRKWYELRYPEKLVIISLIYPGNMIRDFPILKPKHKHFSLESGTYLFSEKAILKNSNSKTEDILKVTIDKVEYQIDLSKKLKYRWERFPRLYYRAGCPYPVIWSEKTDFKDQAGNSANYSASELEDFGKNTIIKQIYSDLQGPGLFIFVFIMLFVIIGICGYIALKISGKV